MPLPRRLGILFLIALGLLAILFRERFLELSGIWLEDDNYSHGFLVPVVSAVLAWRVWCEAGAPRASSPFRGLSWLAVGCFLHLLAVVIWLPPVAYVALVSILYGLALLAGGPGWARKLLFPIAFLFFMFPLPVGVTERVAVWLQLIVANLGSHLLQLFLPVYREGNFIHMPGQQLEVGEACSGLRQIVAFAALTLVVAHVSKRGLPFKIALVLSGLVVAIAANLLRVLLMAFIMRTFGPEWIGGAYHSAWGLVTMALGLGLLLGAHWWLGCLFPEQDTPARAAATAAAAEPALVEVPIQPSLPARSPVRGLTLGVVCLLATVGGQAVVENHLQAGEQSPPLELQQPLTGFPVSLGAWYGQDSLPATLPYFELADDKLCRTYVLQQGPHAGLRCQLWMIHFQDGRDRQHHPLICYKVAGYAEELSGRASLRMSGSSAPVERFGFTRNGVTSYVHYWHYTFEPPVDPQGSLLQLIHQRRGQLLPSLTIEVFATPQTPDQLEEIGRFIQRVNDQVLTHVPPGARMGSDILPVRFTGGPRHGPNR